MITMKALRSFGIAGSNEGKIRRGHEFTAGTEARAKDLEQHGLAYRVETQAEPLQSNPRLSNKAASAGPLPSRGGETGAENAPSSSDQGRQQRGRGSRKPRGGLDL